MSSIVNLFVAQSNTQILFVENAVEMEAFYKPQSEYFNLIKF